MRYSPFRLCCTYRLFKATRHRTCVFAYLWWAASWPVGSRRTAQLHVVHLWILAWTAQNRLPIEAENCSWLEARTECPGKCCKLIARLGQGHSLRFTNTTEANRFSTAQELFLRHMEHLSSPCSLRPTPAHMPSVYDTLTTIIILPSGTNVSSKWCFLLSFAVKNFVRTSFLPGCAFYSHCI